MPDELKYALVLDPAQWEGPMDAVNKHFQEFHSNIAKASTAMAEMYKHTSPGLTGGTGGSGLPQVKKQLEEVGLETKNVREALHLLGDQFGEVGMLGHFLSDPYLLAAAGMVLAFKEVSDQIEITKERMTELAADAAALAAAQFNAVVGAARDVVAANAEMQRSFDDVGKTEDKIMLGYQNHLQFFDAQIEATKQLIDVTDQLNDSRIDGAVALGQMSAQGAMLAKDDSKNAAQKAKDKADDAKADEHVSAAKKLAASESAEASKQLAAAKKLEGGTETTRAALRMNAELAAAEKAKLDAAQGESNKDVGERNAIKAGGWAAIADGAKRAALAGMGATLAGVGLGPATGLGRTGFNMVHNAFYGAQEKTAGDAKTTETERGAVEALARKRAQLEEDLAKAEEPVKIAAQKANAAKAAALKAEEDAHQQDAMNAQRKAARAKLEDAQRALQLQNEINSFNKFGSNILSSAFQATSIEKMGAHFVGSGPSVLADHQRATAQNTAAMLAELRKLNQSIGVGAFSFANQN